MAVGCNVDRRTQTETWEPTTTATESCLNPQLTETTITQNFVCCNERYPTASNDNSEGFQQPFSGKPSSIFIHHWRPRPVPRCTLVVCSHGYVPTCWGRPGSVEWIGVASPLFFCSLPPSLTCRCFLRCFNRSSLAQRHNSQQGESNQQHWADSWSPHLDVKNFSWSAVNLPLKTQRLRKGTEILSWRTKVFSLLLRRVDKYLLPRSSFLIFSSTFSIFSTYHDIVFTLLMTFSPSLKSLIPSSLTLVKCLLFLLSVVKNIDKGVPLVTLL